MQNDKDSDSSYKGKLFIFNPYGAGVLFLTACLVVLYFSFAWKYMTSRGETRNITVESSECVQYRDHVSALRQKFEKTDTGDPSASLTEDQLALAQQLLEIRGKYISECQSGQEQDDWYGALRIRCETTMSANLEKQSSEAEKLGKAALYAGNYQDALQNLAASLKFQNRINTDYPSSDYASVTRSYSLEKLVDDAKYRPMFGDYKKTKAEGNLSYDKGDYTKARDEYLAALNMLRGLSRTIPRSYFNFDEKIRSLESTVTEVCAKIRGSEIDSILSEADVASLSGDYGKAGALFSKALVTQRNLAKDFPNSSLAGPRRSKDIERRMQNALSKPVVAKIEEDLKNLSAALESADDRGVVDSICAAQVAYSELLRTYSESDAAREADYKRIPYLFSVRPDIILLRKAVFSRLLEIPGYPSWKMLDREVSQLIFKKICSDNPSARKSDNLPVEGVTYAEAELFAQRLSWITEKDVRLPDMARYMAVVEPVDEGWVRKGTWNSATAPNREMQPVASSKPNPRGYYDLLGNVSEWIASDIPDASQAYVIGGSVRDNPIRVSQIPKESHDKNERVRNNGFRIMVKTGE